MFCQKKNLMYAKYSFKTTNTSCDSQSDNTLFTQSDNYLS